MSFKRMADAENAAGATDVGCKRNRLSECDITQGGMNGMDCALEYSSLSEAFDSLANQHPDRSAVEDGCGTGWTYAELQAASFRAAACMLTYKLEFDQESAVRPVALLMRRSCAWVASVIAAMRIAVPSLSLSGDLRNAEESQRNREALLEHKPFLLVLDSTLRQISPHPSLEDKSEASLRVVDAAHLLEGIAGQHSPLPAIGTRNPDDLLYIVYTGGTTSASKSVAVTHRMALHELHVYPMIAPLQCHDRVLHQTSAYWGATCLGIFDVAWASGSCLVMSETGAGPAEVAATVKSARISIIGVVPSVLEALEPADCSTLTVVFTWGEALATSTAARWCKHVALVDLLIASEYWLLLYSRKLANSNQDNRIGFHAVDGARLTLLSPTQDFTAGAGLQEVPHGDVGELYVAGPMVSAKGYFDIAKNRDAFVDLPVGTGGCMVRHFRTRDLARRRVDGSLEYCGRADGFAKVGGKWLDLASVERRLLEAGCSQAALVWDSQEKRRHAAVVLDQNPLTRRPLFERAAELQNLLPKDTTLHVRASLPKNPATGKLNRGRLLNELSLENSMPQDLRAAQSVAAARRVGRAFALGLLLAGRVGARGAIVSSLAWCLAPGMKPASPYATPRALAGLPQSVASSIAKWHAWHCAVGSCLPLSCMRALPQIALLMMDSQHTGLKPFASMFQDGPIGILGSAMLFCFYTAPWMRELLMAAGAVHARKGRGGSKWSWAFWLGFPWLAEAWQGECWQACGRGELHHDVSGQFLAGQASLLKMNSNKLPVMKQCYQCSAFVTNGKSFADGNFYCRKCNDRWYTSIRAAQAVDAPMDSKESLEKEAAPAVDVPMDSKECLEKEASPSPTVWQNRKDRPVWFPGLSEIDFTEAEVLEARASMPGRKASNSAVRPNPGASSPVARIVERCTGIDVSSPTASLASIESLKLIQIVSTLRRELGLSLIGGDVARCSCLSELEELCAQVEQKGAAQSNKAIGDDDDGNGTWAITAIPRFFTAPVGSFIRLDTVPQERAMHAAACALIRRHPGLRAQPYATESDEWLAEMCNGVAPMLVLMKILVGDNAQGFLVKAVEGMLASWPRVTALPAGKGAVVKEHWRHYDYLRLAGEALPENGPEVAHFHCLRLSKRKDLIEAAYMRKRSRGFKTPAQIALLLLNESEDSAATGGCVSMSSADEAYLHVAVNHAVSDGFCIVPLIADLLALHAAAVKAECDGHFQTDIGSLADRALEIAELPEAPNGLALQQKRLRDAITPSSSVADCQDMCEGVFNLRRRGYDHYVRLKPGASSLLEAGAVVMGIPEDHLLVTAIAAAFAALVKKPIVKFTLIVPMRDGVGEGNCIANFANTRHLKILFGSRSFFEVAMDLSLRLRRREWALCDVLDDDVDRLYVNIRDIPTFEGAHAIVEDINTRLAKTKFVKHAIEMNVDKEQNTAWAFYMGIREDLDGNVFAELLKKALWNTAVAPLGPATPSIHP